MRRGTGPASRAGCAVNKLLKCHAASFPRSAAPPPRRQLVTAHHQRRKRPESSRGWSGSPYGRAMILLQPDAVDQFALLTRVEILAPDRRQLLRLALLALLPLPPRLADPSRSSTRDSGSSRVTVSEVVISLIAHLPGNPEVIGQTVPVDRRGLARRAHLDRRR